MFEMRPYNYRRNGMMNYNPFKELENFEKNFFDDDFNMFDELSSGFKTDIRDNGDSYVLEADLPGFDKKDINIDVNNGYLTVKAERHSEKEEKDKRNNFIRSERSYGCYSRSFDVSNVETDSIHAKYENGVLTLTMPKNNKIPDTAKHLEIE